ncbi:MAG: CRISPR-associated protein Cas5 [Deltaproteobacteria bacterium]|nr:CRISPR-associated protein Cas5 [Deltaproteobacteria bacterium]
MTLGSEFVVFDIEAQVAQFRCIYSNVSTLSYHFPPRNTVVGILAAILGLERERPNNEGYYGLLGRDKCGIAVRMMSPVRKIQFTVNYLDTGSSGLVDKKKITGKGRRKQTPVEYVIGAGISRLKYRIYVLHNDPYVRERLREKVEKGRSVYPLSLGPAYCCAFISFVSDDIVDEQLHDAQPHQTYWVVTVVPEKALKSIELTEVEKLQRSGQSLRIVREENLPPDFGPRREPLPQGGGNFYFEESGKPMPLKLNPVKIFKTKDGYGVFM